MSATPLARRLAVPPTALVMGAVVSVQLGSAVATHLFGSIGPGGAAFLRLLVGAVILVALSRPATREMRWSAMRWAILFGLAVAAMNFCFYSAIDRIPLGIGVALEFTGPLGVAVAGSRRPLDALWVALAGAGVILLTPWGGLTLNLVGVLLAMLTGGFWASYILLSAKVGKLYPGSTGLTIAMIAGAIALAPVGVMGGGTVLLLPQTLVLGTAVGILSSVVPYSLELEALRTLPTRVFGVLMSTEPAVGAIAGFLFLGQILGLRSILAIALVCLAATGASLFGHGDTASQEASP